MGTDRADTRIFKSIAGCGTFRYKRYDSPHRVEPMTASTILRTELESSAKQRSLPYWTSVVALILVLVIELMVPALRQSAIFDEGCHLLAGYSYWTRGDFGINPEHPPAVKLLATIPLLGQSLHYPPPSQIPFFKAACFVGGRDFVYSNTLNADSILRRARFAAAILTLFAALLTFAAAREMFGQTVGLVALLLFVFEPNLLAHGSLVTTDMGISLCFLATIYSFYRFAKRPSWLRLGVAGVAAGLALAAKFSAVLVLPVLALLALAEVVHGDPESRLAAGGRFKHAMRLAAALVVVSLIAWMILWSFYGFRFAARPANQTITPPLSAYISYMKQPRLEKVMMTIARHHLLPEAYIYGFADVMITPRYMNSYIFGTLYRHGKWFYFPGAMLIKSTLGLLILVVLFPLALFRNHGNRRELLFLIIPVAIYLAAAMQSNFNIGVRHILPVYPFLIILAAFTAATLAPWNKAFRYGISGLIVFSVISSVRAFPAYLPYANEIWGGPSHTYKFLTDSNVDWGQQLKQTKTYLDAHRIQDCWFDYFASSVSDPRYYGIQCKPLQNGLGLPVPTPARIAGTVLISATELTPELWGPGELNPYLRFAQRKPDDSIANGVFVFRGDFDIPLAAANYHAGAAWLILQNEKASEGQIQQALSEAQTAVSLSPDICAPCREVLGDVLMKLNRKDEARTAYTQALEEAQGIYPEFQDDEIAGLKKKLQ